MQQEAGIYPPEGTMISQSGQSRPAHPGISEGN
jgi:hypothetical protein